MFRTALRKGASQVDELSKFSKGAEFSPMGARPVQEDLVSGADLMKMMDMSKVGPDIVGQRSKRSNAILGLSIGHPIPQGNTALPGRPMGPTEMIPSGRRPSLGADAGGVSGLITNNTPLPPPSSGVSAPQRHTSPGRGTVPGLGMGGVVGLLTGNKVQKVAGPTRAHLPSSPATIDPTKPASVQDFNPGNAGMYAGMAGLGMLTSTIGEGEVSAQGLFTGAVVGMGAGAGIGAMTKSAAQGSLNPLMRNTMTKLKDMDSSTAKGAGDVLEGMLDSMQAGKSSSVQGARTAMYAGAGLTDLMAANPHRNRHSRGMNGNRGARF